MNNLYFFNRLLEVNDAIMPDNVLWRNMGKSRCNYLMRQFVQFLIGFTLLLVAVFFTINVYSYQYYLMRHFVIPGECPVDTTKLGALNDYSSSDSGLMHCYCYNEVFDKGNTGILTDYFSDVAHHDQAKK